MRAKLTYVDLTIFSHEANFTLTLVTIELIYTVSLVMTGILLTVVSVGVAHLPLIARLAVAVEVIDPVLTAAVETGAGQALVSLLLTVEANIAWSAVTQRALTVLQTGPVVEAGTGLAPPRQTGGRGDGEVITLRGRLTVLSLRDLTVQREGLTLASLLTLLRTQANLSPAGRKHFEEIFQLSAPHCWQVWVSEFSRQLFH